MDNDNNNGKVPIKIIQLLVEKMEIGIKNSQEKINKEIEELTEAITTMVNRINSTNKILVDKLDLIKSKVSKMILVASIVFAMLMASVALAVFGSQILYKYNTDILIEKIVAKDDKRDIKIPEEIKNELKSIIKEYINEINKEKIDRKK